MSTVVTDAEGTDVRALAELVRGVPGVRVVRGEQVPVRRVHVDSRRISPGDVFAALPGQQTDGRRFVADALQRGAAAVLTPPDAEVPAGVPWITAENARAAAALLAAAAWGHPATRLEAAGFTGTNGKTTCTFLLDAIARRAGRRTAVIGTLGAYLPDGRRPQARTTPEAPDLQELLSDAVAQGTEIAALEVSSHALDLHRVDGIPFAAAAFLNLTGEHLDWHGTMERYCASKMRLFSELLASGRTRMGRSRAVLSGTDPWASRFREVVEDAVSFAVDDEGAEVTARGLRVEADGTAFELATPEGRAPVLLRLPGRYNVENALAAASVAWVLGMSTDAIATGLSAAGAPPGRFERVHSGSFDAYVDYAHTEDGLARVLEVARGLARRRLIVVLGCGGDRDTRKRAGMGRIAAQTADLAIFTSDNPRHEDPAEIVEAMLAGVTDTRRVEVVLDRETALGRAVAAAGPGDLVIATGKGHETYQEIGDERLPFPEREILARLAAERDGAAA